MAKIRVRARTIDMLGRQQIAGIPTAISELFKNAHDAYAKNVVVDFYRSDRLFVLRDDGIGMTKSEFEDRWLTIGTESKLGEAGMDLPPRDPLQPERPILGEKGIGRLAIAAIGPQVLILTRARRSNKPDMLVASFIHWGVFALPGVDLDEIDLPVQEFPGGTLPNAAAIALMINSFRDTVKAISKRSKFVGDEILRDLTCFSVDPLKADEFLSSDLSLRGNGRGTHFYIVPSDETIPTDIDGTPGQEIAPPLIKVLGGFANTMTPGHRPPPIRTGFWDYQLDGVREDRIAEGEFFTEDEFKGADHHFNGHFDRYGQFKGTVTVYHQNPVDCVIPWKGAAGSPTDCGPFSLNVAYVQGAQRESLLPQEEHARMVAKLNRIGGLYIYRDSIRVLPYGNSDYDFLNIEQRRTKSASYYFFSYRRLFGVIDISRKSNAALAEKAGREGFRENKAYRQFRLILENFFLQLAADFFRDGGVRTRTYEATKAELDRNELLRRKRAQQVRTKREAFALDLDKFFASINNDDPSKQIASLEKEVSSRLAVLSKVSDKSSAAIALQAIAVDIKDRLETVRAQFRVVRPRDAALTKQLRRDWEAYQAEASRIETDILDPAINKVDEMIDRFVASSHIPVDNRRQIESEFADALLRGRRRVSSARAEIVDELNSARIRAIERAQASLQAVEVTIEEVNADLARTRLEEMTARQLSKFAKQIEEKVVGTVNAEMNVLQKLRGQLQAVATSEGLEAADTTIAIEEELDALRDEEVANLELSQVGMALGIIHHEFAGCAKAIRRDLKSLQRWADTNEGLRAIYEDIRVNFEHLDGYLTLFTPLNRRLYRKKIDITGKAIYQFLLDLFGDRIKRHNIELLATDAFRQKAIFGFPSSFYPCFVNLVDNSIYWLTESRAKKRQVLLDVAGESFIVSDTGPGIDSRDREAVFELGFTRKVGGRGMGLHISKATLARVGYKLTLDNQRPGAGASFRIGPAS